MSSPAGESRRPPDRTREKGKKKGKPERVERPMDSQVVADLQGTRMAEEGHPAVPKPERKPSRWVGRIVVFALVAALVGAALYWGVPEFRWAMATVSTDDAFVSGHTTYVSPRINGFVTEVMVEQNDRVEPGTILVRIDREPFVIALKQSESSLAQARANLELAKAQVKSQLASARGAFFSRRSQQQQLSQQIRSLESQVAALRASQSSQRLAELDQRRLNALTTRGSATQSELDQRNNTLERANQSVTEAWTSIQETRASLGLAPDYERPQEVPKDLLEKQSTIESAGSSIASSLAQIGIPFDASKFTPGEAFEQMLKMNTSEGLENAFNHIVDEAPAVTVAQAGCEQGGARPRQQQAAAQLDRDPLGDRRLRPGPISQPWDLGRGRSKPDFHPTGLRLDRRELQGNTDPRHQDRHAGRSVC